LKIVVDYVLIDSSGLVDVLRSLSTSVKTLIQNDEEQRNTKLSRLSLCGCHSFHTKDSESSVECCLQELVMEEKEWIESDIYDDDTEDQSPGIFHFENDEDYFETVEYNFAGIPMIRVRHQGDYPTSTGLAVWAGAEVGCRHLLKHPHVAADKKVLELGSGSGLCGIVAHYLGASKVLWTDGDQSVLKNLRYNIGLNNLCGEQQTPDDICVQLIWGHGLEKALTTFGKQDVIVACDCVYMSKSLKPLWETVDVLLGDDGCFLWVNVSASQVSLHTVLKTASTHDFIWSVASDHEKIYSFR